MFVVPAPPRAFRMGTYVQRAAKDPSVAFSKGLLNGCCPDILEDALAAVGSMGPPSAGKVIGERGPLQWKEDQDH